MGLGKILVKGDEESYCGGPQIFQICRNHIEILRPERGTESKFHSEDPQIICVTVKM